MIQRKGQKSILQNPKISEMQRSNGRSSERGTHVSEFAYKKAVEVTEKYNTRNPFEIADASGIIVIYNNEFCKLKGFYAIINRQRYMVLNGNLDERARLVVAAHELGHDMLHREFAKNGALHEYMLYDMKTRPEYEANVFAAELLITDENINKRTREGADMQQIAVELGVDINLVAVKVGNMNTRGHIIGRNTNN